MPHDLLDGAGVGASFQTVGGIAVAKLMRENRNAEFAPCMLDGPLHVGLMHPETDNGLRHRVAAGVVGREKPGPSPTELVFGVFSGQTMRQHHGRSVLLIALPDSPG